MMRKVMMMWGMMIRGRRPPMAINDNDDNGGYAEKIDKMEITMFLTRMTLTTTTLMSTILTIRLLMVMTRKMTTMWVMNNDDNGNHDQKVDKMERAMILTRMMLKTTTLMSTICSMTLLMAMTR